MKPPFVLSLCDSVFSLHEYYFANPNGEGVHNWISHNISNFHDNPTVSKTGIVVLSKQLWVSAGKGKTTKRGVFLLAQTWYKNSQRWECSEIDCECGAQISRQSNGEWVRDYYFSEIGLVDMFILSNMWCDEYFLMKWSRKIYEDIIL